METYANVTCILFLVLSLSLPQSLFWHVFLSEKRLLCFHKLIFGIVQCAHECSHVCVVCITVFRGPVVWKRSKTLI